MRGVCSLGAFPTNFGTTNLISVDHCAKSTVAITLKLFPKENNREFVGKVIHLTNPDGDTSYDQLFSWISSYISAKYPGRNFVGIPLSEFRSRLSSHSDNPLFPLLSNFDSSHSRHFASRKNATSLELSEKFVAEKVSQELIHKILSELV
jgi:hypothetical protein